MQSYLAMIQNALGGVDVPMYFAAALLIASIALCLLVRGRYRGKLKKLGSELVQAQMAHEQLKATQEGLQQSEEALRLFKTQTEQAHQQVAAFLETVGKEWAIAYDQDAATDHDGDIWQRQEYVVSQLINRLKEMQNNQQNWDMQLDVLNNTFAEQREVQSNMEDMLANLQTKNQAYKEYTAKLETNRMKVFNDLNLSAQKIRQLTLDHKAEQGNSEAEVVKLHEQQRAYQRAYKVQLGKLEWDRIKIFDDLNVALQKIRDLEAILQNKEESVVEDVTPVLVPEAPVPTSVQVQEILLPPLATVPELAETIEPPQQSQPLFAKLMDSVKADFDLGKKFAQSMAHVGGHHEVKDEKPTLPAQTDSLESTKDSEKDAISTKRQQELAARPGHDLEVKDRPLKESRQVAGSAAIVKQESKSQWFNPFKKPVGQEPVLPRESVDQKPLPAIDEVVDVDIADQQASGQLKSFYQKIIGFTGKSVKQAPELPEVPVLAVIDEAADVEVTAQQFPGQLKSLYQKMISFTGKK
ncbi:MAG: hypothetical protein PHH59_12095 [Methylovulum sp.]|uniref:hypothetical protein n=1 Tax=Methylovulum sp. TaxID=1916980 RepID=UPI00261B596C|nr:hypothetical protein [Methylovulum sp.]MDD2724749.1 hypothetical protein [Methylovulum sp.]MDD5124760.1 hypothetical protein [Methylovulum sp.]